MPISEQTYERVALEDGDERWELVCGRLRKKPGMTAYHGDIPRTLAHILAGYLPLSEFTVAEGSGRVRVSTGSFYVPDLCVIPRAFVDRQKRERRERLEVYEEPLPLVVEVWSPSTGEYDVDTKFPEYRRRGDEEIWRIHPHEQTLTAWRRQPDGSYSETLYREGSIGIASLPGVAIELAELFL